MKEEGEKSGNVEELEMEVQGKKVWRVGGVGMWSYSMDPAEERVKSGLWNKLSRSHGRKDWLAAARARTAFYTGSMSSTTFAILSVLTIRFTKQAIDSVEIG